MRLIDADYLKEVFDGFNDSGTGEENLSLNWIKELIDEQPTVETKYQEIITKLEAKKKNICGRYGHNTPTLERPSCKVAFNIGIEEAIEVVREVGGMDANT